MEYKTIDGNEAASLVAYKFSEIVGIYPITPASPMAEHIDVYSSKGVKNYFGNAVLVKEMQSEAGAIALVHGALQAGSLASTFTASQGLLLMIPSLYKLAGEMLPAVVHVAARSLSTHALSIFGDHQDIYATRMTGCAILASSSVQDAYFLSAIAHLSAIKSSMPFIHFFDGFRTSHEINKIKTIDLEKYSDLIDEEALKKFRAKSLLKGNSTTRGTAQNEDVYFQNMESRNKDYEETIDNVIYYMDKINKLTGFDYKPFTYYGKKNAKNVIVAMGSVCDTIKETVDVLNKKDYSIGVITVHLYRPFSAKHLLSVLPKTVKNIAVLDRTKEAGSSGEPLYLDVLEALKDTKIKIIGGRYGLSSKDTTPGMIKGIFDHLDKRNKVNHFTIGINDDVTNLSLPYNDFNLNNKHKELLIYGYGSDGMVSTSKDVIKIIGDNTSNFVQGYFQYDSKKSGGVTRCHLRISNYEIRAPYYVKNADIIVISKDRYIYTYDILDDVKDNSIVLLNTPLDKETLIKSLPNKVKYNLALKNIKFYIINAYSIASKHGLKNKINTCLETCIFKLLDVLSMDKVLNILRENNYKRFYQKGSDIVEANNKVIMETLEHLEEIEIDKSWLNLKIEETKNNDFYDVINKLKGNELPVSAFLKYKDGVFEGGTTKSEKRNISDLVPCWINENCIQCNQCSFVCPHAVIRPFLLTEDEAKNVSGAIKAIGPGLDNYYFKIGVSYDDCTGCGLCAYTCPGKKGEKALKLEDYQKDKFKQEEFNYLINNVKNKNTSEIINVKNSQFNMPSFFFSGACAGCGETPYLKNLTQVFKDNLIIANATGCSSIYGGSLPSMPYTIPWASSLFEDNSEYGYGMLLSFIHRRDMIKRLMEEKKDTIDKETKTLFEKWLANPRDEKACLEIYQNLDYEKVPFLKNLKESIPVKHIFVVGGDGFAYDIGYGGLDHVISNRENIKILVLDTEVYSNTGGQSSKSSHMGSIASFTAKGKQNYKKDLARMALNYPHVYVATVNIGYNKEHYVKVLKEASSYDGPALIIAYAPCIEQGIKKGMNHSLENAKLATECGYYPLFRYNPSTKKFTLDSKIADFDKYKDFLLSENRYASLYVLNKEEGDSLLEKEKEWAINRFKYYQSLEEKE